MALENSFGGYRYGFNGQERETEINPSVTSAEYWMYDGRLGRRWNIDPVRKFSSSEYSVLANNPIKHIDPNGDKEYKSKKDFEKQNKGKSWDKDRGKGDWLFDDRKYNTNVWSEANAYNLKQTDGFKEYTTIAQRADSMIL